jgi:hypothetical protein
MLDLLERTHCFGSSFGTNALAMAFAEGERNVGLQLLNDIMSVAPDQYVLMMREKNGREHADARTLNGSGSADEASGVDDTPASESGDSYADFGTSAERSPERIEPRAASGSGD